jgi:hypothetical protein
MIDEKTPIARADAFLVHLYLITSPDTGLESWPALGDL